MLYEKPWILWFDKEGFFNYNKFLNFRCLDPEVVKELSTENQAQKDQEDIMIDCDDDPKMIISDNDDEIIEEHSNDDRDLDHEIKNSNKHQNHRRRSMPRLRSLRNNKNKTNIPQSKTTCDFQKSCENELPDTNRFVGSLLSVFHLNKGHWYSGPTEFDQKPD